MSDCEMTAYILLFPDHSPKNYRGACGINNVASDFIVALNTAVSSYSVSSAANVI